MKRLLYKNKLVTKKKVVIKTKSKKLTNAKNNDKIKGIISLTSWKARIQYVHKTIESFLRNTNGFKVVLVLCEEEFPNKERDLPSTITKLISKRFEILWVRKNYKAFKKVLFTMEKYPNFPIISADDDMICLQDYPSVMYEKWSKNKDSFITAKAHTFEKVFLPVKSAIPHTFGCCTLYPPRIFGEYGIKCLTDDILECYESDAYYSALKYYLGLDKCIIIQSLNKMFKFTSTDEISPMRDVYVNDNRKNTRKKIFEYVKRNISHQILQNATILTANFNVPIFTRNMIASMRKQLGFDIHVTILDNSTIVPWDNSIVDNVSVIDNTNFKLTPDYQQPSMNHGYSLDYALKHINKEWVILSDCDMLYKPKIKQLLAFMPNEFDICGEIGHDVMPKDRIFPYLCIINNKKLKENGINFFDEQTDLKKGFDTGYSLMVNAKRKKLKIKKITISDYSHHLKGGVLRNKDYNEWFEKHKELF